MMEKSFPALLLSVIRYVYITAALTYVGLNFVKTYEKIQQGRTMVSIAENDLPKYLFPSVTICTKFKDGNRNILPLLWIDNWKDSGENISRGIFKVTKAYM